MRNRKKVVTVLAGVVLAAAVLGACGGGGSSSGEPSIIGPQTTGPKGANNDFASLVAKTNAATYKVTYKSADGTSFTIAQDPPRFSYVSGDSSTYIGADGSAVTCAGGGSSATCTALPGSADSIKQGLTSAFGSIGALLVTEAGKGIPGLTSITKTSNQTIAGRDGVCATIDSKSLGVLGSALGGASYSVCVDKQTGVMLSTTTDDGKGQKSAITATSFGTPSAADLTPPATPQSIPGLTSTTT